MRAADLAHTPLPELPAAVADYLAKLTIDELAEVLAFATEVHARRDKPKADPPAEAAAAE